MSIKPVTEWLHCYHVRIATQVVNGVRGDPGGCAESFVCPVRCATVMLA